jgi:hypothetical protein
MLVTVFNYTGVHGNVFQNNFSIIMLLQQTKLKQAAYILITVFQRVNCSNVLINEQTKMHCKIIHK